MTKWILGLLAVAILAVPSTAAAEPFTPELEADYSSALVWWGVPSPPQCSSVSLEIVPGRKDADGIATLAEATMPLPGDVALSCGMRVYARSAVDAREEWGPAVLRCLLAMTVRHEVGHLLGNGHSTDPHSIMAPSIDAQYWCPAQFAARRRTISGQLNRERPACQKLTDEELRHRARLCWYSVQVLIAEYRGETRAVAAN